MRWLSLKSTEHQEQKTVIEYCEAMQLMLPEASLLFAIANGGLRPKRYRIAKNGKLVRYSPEAQKLRAEGVKPGIPDLFLPVARQEWHGLFIEMKTEEGDLRLDQRLWIGILTAQKYAVCVCRGSDAAITAIRGYLTNPAWSPGHRGE